MDSVLIIKVISALIYPLGLASVLVLLSLFGLKKRFFLSLAALILVLASNSNVARWLAFQLERQYPQQHIADIATHDAIIVLGGGLRIPQAPALYTQIGSGSDRYWYAARLYRAGKAKTIILAGGNVFEQPGLKGEAHYGRELLMEWGVPAAAILAETQSRTTEQNRRGIASFLLRNRVQSALLVTSALHMPRAHKSFSQLPIPITPASADVLIRQSYAPPILNWMPSAGALHLSTVALHEYYGFWFNELKALMDKFW